MNKKEFNIKVSAFILHLNCETLLHGPDSRQVESINQRLYLFALEHNAFKVAGTTRKKYVGLGRDDVLEMVEDHVGTLDYMKPIFETLEQLEERYAAEDDVPPRDVIVDFCNKCLGHLGTLLLWRVLI